MRPVSIIGAYETRWGVLKERTIHDLLAEAGAGALTNAGLESEAIQFIYLGNAFAETLTGQAALASVAADAIGIPHVPGIRFECACCSGAAALRDAYLHVAAGIYDFVLVAGVEKMNTRPMPEILRAIAASFSQEDQAAGIVAPAVFALYAQAHMAKYGTTRAHLASVAAKNYANGLLNPVAHWRKPVSIDEILASPMIAEPLSRHDCSLVTDGAAALVLCPAESAGRFQTKPINIKASAIAGESYKIACRDSYTSFSSTVRAAAAAYAAAKVGPKDISAAETHDCFTITELINLEDLGFFARGDAAGATQAGFTSRGGALPINVSGGLKAKGHAIGATGVGQVVEAVSQLRGEAGVRQIDHLDLFLTHMLGGAPSVSVVHIFERGY
jgi:acetyl-CoA C-acetyltransferase